MTIDTSPTIATTPSTYQGDPTLDAASARFDRLRAAPSLRSCAEALNALSNIAIDVAPSTISNGAVARLRSAIAAAEPTIVALLPGYEDSTCLALGCAHRLVDLLAAGPQAVDAANADGTALDDLDGVCLAACEFEAHDRRQKIRRRAAARERAAVLSATLAGAQPGDFLH